MITNYISHLQLHVRHRLCHTLPILIHHLHTQTCATLGAQMVINEVLLLQVTFADAARIVLAQAAAVITAAGAPAGQQHG